MDLTMTISSLYEDIENIIMADSVNYMTDYLLVNRAFFIGIRQDPFHHTFIVKPCLSGCGNKTGVRRQAGVGIYLNQEGLIVPVNTEIKTGISA